MRTLFMMDFVLAIFILHLTPFYLSSLPFSSSFSPFSVWSFSYSHSSLFFVLLPIFFTSSLSPSSPPCLRP
jgi:hypothetical protein